MAAPAAGYKPNLADGSSYIIPCYSPLAILTALTLRAVFRLALRQTEGLIGSIIGLLGLELRVPDHSTLSRRAATLQVPRPQPCRDGEPLHLLVDSTGLRLCGAGEWLLETQGTKTRRSWRKRPIGLDAGTGRIVAASLTAKEARDGAEVGPLLDQVTGAVSSFTADGGYDQDRIHASIAQRHPEAAVIVPPRATAVASDAAETAPTQRDRHLQHIAGHGRMPWQKASGYTTRARAEAAIGRFKQVIGDGLRSRTDDRRATEVDAAVHALNRMAELGRPNSVRTVWSQTGTGLVRPLCGSVQQAGCGLPELLPGWGDRRPSSAPCTNVFTNGILCSTLSLRIKRPGPGPCCRASPARPAARRAPPPTPRRATGRPRATSPCAPSRIVAGATW